MSKLESVDWLYDMRTECFSVLTTLTAREYLALVRRAHSLKGALSGQRDSLKTTTAKRIRARMVSDIRRGAVLPPVVIGAVIPEEFFKTYPVDAEKVEDFLPTKYHEDISIIDGMQRTTALLEAAEQDSSVLDQSFRVEFWLTRSVRTMIYRMLVLNTGQVPWTLSRQLSVVYEPLLAEIKENVPELSKVSSPDTPGRRVAAGQFGSDALVELYMSYSLRKTSIDTRETLSDEFSRLDFVENLSNQHFQESFYSAISLLAKFDYAFSRFDPGTTEKLSKGRNIFDSQPARIGFVTSVALHVIGRPGMERPDTESHERMQELIQKANLLIDRLNGMEAEAVGDFLKLDVLRETLDRRVGQVGRYERSVYSDAFRVLIEEDFELRDMEPCWRAN